MQLFYKKDLEFPEDCKVNRSKFQTAVKTEKKRKQTNKKDIK